MLLCIIWKVLWCLDSPPCPDCGTQELSRGIWAHAIIKFCSKQTDNELDTRIAIMSYHMLHVLARQRTNMTMS